MGDHLEGIFCAQVCFIFIQHASRLRLQVWLSAFSFPVARRQELYDPVVVGMRQIFTAMAARIIMLLRIDR